MRHDSVTRSARALGALGLAPARLGSLALEGEDTNPETGQEWFVRCS